MASSSLQPSSLLAGPNASAAHSSAMPPGPILQQMMRSDWDKSDTVLEPETAESDDRQLSRIDEEDTEMPDAPDFEDPAAEREGAALHQGQDQGSAPSPIPVATGHVENSSEHTGDDAHPENLSGTPALRQRLLKMLTGEGERPVGSGEPAAAQEATNELILAAVEAFGPLRQGTWQWWAQNKDAIAASCSPALVDKEESLGYLLADALGHALLVPEDARTVGKRGFAQAKAVEKRIAEERQCALSAVRRAARVAGNPVDGAQREAAAAAARARVLGARYDLNIPARTVGARRAVPTPPPTEQELAAAKHEADVARARAELAEDTELTALTAALLEAHSTVVEVLHMCAMPPDRRWQDHLADAHHARNVADSAWQARMRSWSSVADERNERTFKMGTTMDELCLKMANAHLDIFSIEGFPMDRALLILDKYDLAFDRCHATLTKLSARSVGLAVALAQLHKEAHPPLDAACRAVEDAYLGVA